MELPPDLILEIYKWVSLPDFFKSACINQSHWRLVDKNAFYMIDYHARKTTIFGLFEEALQAKSYFTIRALLWYTRTNVFLKLPPQARASQSEALVKFALSGDHLDILELMFQSLPIFHVSIPGYELSGKKMYEMMTKPNMLLARMFVDLPQHLVDLYSGILSYLTGSFEQLRSIVLNFFRSNYMDQRQVNLMSPYYYRYYPVPYLPQIAEFVMELPFRGPELMTILLEEGLLYRGSMMNYDYDYADSYIQKLADYLIERIPMRIKQWYENRGEGKHKKKYLQLPNYMIVSIIKYNQVALFGLDEQFWKTQGSAELYLDLYRRDPTSPYLRLIRLRFSRRLYIEKIPIDVVLRLFQRVKHNITFISRGDDIEYVEQLRALRDTGKPFSFYANFGVRVKLARNTQELLHYLSHIIVDMSTIFSTDGDTVASILVDFNQRLPRTEWDKIKTVWDRFHLNEMLSWIIRTDDTDLYEYLMASFNPTEIYIPPPFRSKKMERLYLEDYGSIVEGFVGRSHNTQARQLNLGGMPLLPEAEFNEEEDDSDDEEDRTTVEDLLKMSDINPESYWWLPWLAPQFMAYLH